MNYYRRYVGDFQRDTGHLSLAEVGAYDRLLDHYYATEVSLPVSIPVCVRIARATTSEEREAVESVLAQFFPVVEGKRSNRRADHEITVSKQARANGSRGGRPSARETGNKTGNVTGIETGNGTETITGSGHPPASSLQPPAFSLQKPAAKLARGALALGDEAPDWLPVEAWNDYASMRVKIRKPLTARAAKLAIEKLEDLRAAGNDPKAVLDQSTFNSWQGIFALKSDRKGTGGSASAVERFVSGGGRA